MAGPPGSFISDFKRAFGKRFNVQDLGPVSWLLGMTVMRHRAAGVLKVGQRQYILDMLERFNMSNCKPVSTPMTVGALSEATASEVLSLSPDVPNQSLIGSLLYASVSTRPDINMAVSHLSRYMARPSTAHWEQAKRVLRYLQGTLDWQLVYAAGDSTATLTGYSDADFAGDADGRRSRTAFVFLLNGAVVSWKSQRQPTVALSTAEAEYMALTANGLLPTERRARDPSVCVKDRLHPVNTEANPLHECVEAPNFLPSYVPEARQRKLLAQGHGITPDIVYALGVPCLEPPRLGHIYPAPVRPTDHRGRLLPGLQAAGQRRPQTRQI